MSVAPAKPLDFLAHVRSESARFRAVLANCDPAARVPTCPDWDAGDLVTHLAGVQAFWGTLARQRSTTPDVDDELAPVEGYEARLAQFDTCHALLVDALDPLPDDTEVWTWFADDHTAGFLRRRQAHEALIHRIDAELTAGELSPVDPDLATDGAQEVLDWMYSAPPPWATHDLDGPVGVVATADTDASWPVRVGRWSGTSPNSGKTYRDEPTLVRVDAGEPVFSVRGAARDLDAWLWNRPTLTDVEVTGDAEAFLAVIRSGVQ